MPLLAYLICNTRPDLPVVAKLVCSDDIVHDRKHGVDGLVAKREGGVDARDAADQRKQDSILALLLDLVARW